MLIDRLELSNAKNDCGYRSKLVQELHISLLVQRTEHTNTSNATAPMIKTPVNTEKAYAATPANINRFCMNPNMSAQKKTPIIDPLPPNRFVPLMVTAAITVNSSP